MMVSRTLLAKYLGEISPVDVNRLVADEILPRPRQRGRYDLEECVRAYLQFLRESGLDDGDVNDDAQPVRDKAELADIQYLTLTGRTLDVERMRATWTWILNVLQARLAEIPARCAAQGANKSKVSLEKIIQAEIYEALRPFSDRRRRPNRLSPQPKGVGVIASAAKRRRGGQRLVRRAACRCPANDLLVAPQG